MIPRLFVDIKVHILISISVCLAFSCFGQGTIQWQNSFGGSDTEFGNSIRQTFDGGFIVLGESISDDGDVTATHTNYEYWIIKISNSGLLEWQKTLGGSNAEIGLSVRQCTDSGYILAGYTGSYDGNITYNHGDRDFWIVKLDVDGNMEWQRTLGGSYTDFAYDIEQTSDDGFIVTGESNSVDGDVTGNHGNDDIWVVKLDSLGNIIWQNSFGGSQTDRSRGIRQTNEGGYIVAGETSSNDGDVTGLHGGYDFWIVKLSDVGAIEWTKTLGGSNHDYAMEIKQTFDGGFIMVGESNSNDGDVTGNHGIGDYWVVKVDSLGNIEWSKSYGGTSADVPLSVIQTRDSGIVVAGYSSSTDFDITNNNGNSDVWILKLDQSGSLLWQSTYGGAGFEQAMSVIECFDGALACVGFSEYISGDVTINHGSFDYWVLKLSTSTGLSESSIDFMKPIIYPQPITFSSVISFDLLHSEKLKIQIYDIQNKLIFESKKDLQFKNGHNEIALTNIYEGHLNSGIYYSKLIGDNFSRIIKFIATE